LFFALVQSKAQLCHVENKVFTPHIFIWGPCHLVIWKPHSRLDHHLMYNIKCGSWCRNQLWCSNENILGLDKQVMPFSSSKLRSYLKAYWHQRLL